MNITYDELEEIAGELVEAMNEGKDFIRQYIRNKTKPIQIQIVNFNGNVKIIEAIFRETQFPVVRELILQNKCNYELVERLKRKLPDNLTDQENQTLKKLIKDFSPN